MRLIDADALIDFIDMGHYRNPLESCFSERDVVDMLESRPTIEAEPVKHGRWVQVSNNPWDGARCSACGRYFRGSEWEDRFCKVCGAKMDGGEAE